MRNVFNPLLKYMIIKIHDNKKNDKYNIKM